MVTWMYFPEGLGFALMRRVVIFGTPNCLEMSDLTSAAWV
jgi:hypothetical protein